jgi:signal transduction histidine kinase
MYVFADEDRLVTTLSHLVQNAQDATPKDGFVKLRLERQGKYCLIQVEDNGSGMDEQFIRERLFKPFDTTKGLTGMGIGAHESRAYFEEMGGKMTVTSKLGQGTCITIHLPLAPQNNL